MIAGPLFPDGAAKAAPGAQNGISGLGPRALVFPRLGILACRNNGLRATPRNGFMAAFRVIGAVATDAHVCIIHANLVEQIRQYRRVAGGIVGYLDGLDFQRGGVYTQVHLAPLTAIVGAMLLSPSPIILIPVLSTSKCNPVVFE